MRRLVWLLVPLLMAADLSAPQGMLQRGEYANAVRAFRAASKQSPGDGAPWIGMARAYAALGRCEEAVDAMRGWRGDPAYNSRAALADGWCAYRLGDNVTAQAAALDAVWLKPNLGPGWYLLALASQRLEDAPARAVAMEGLGASQRGGTMAALAEAWETLDVGDEEGLAAALSVLRELAPDNPRSGIEGQVAIMDATRWFDVGDPYRAERVLASGHVRHDDQVRILLLRAEAMRRLGFLAQAAARVQHPRLRPRRNPLPRAVRLRILVDQGQLDIPVSRLPTLAASSALEDQATGWYISRALGDAEGMAAFRARWALINRSPTRTLEQLIPVTLEAP